MSMRIFFKFFLFALLLLFSRISKTKQLQGNTYLIATIASKLPKFPTGRSEDNKIQNLVKKDQTAEACLTGNAITKQLLFKQGQNSNADVRYLSQYYTSIQDSCQKKVQLKNKYSGTYLMMIYYLSAYNTLQDDYKAQTDNIISYYFGNYNFDRAVNLYGYKIKSSLCVNDYIIKYTPAYSTKTVMYILQNQHSQQFKQISSQKQIQVNNLLDSEDWYIKIGYDGLNQQSSQDWDGQGLYYIDVYRRVKNYQEFGRCCQAYGMQADLTHISCINKQASTINTDQMDASTIRSEAVVHTQPSNMPMNINIYAINQMPNTITSNDKIHVESIQIFIERPPHNIQIKSVTDKPSTNTETNKIINGDRHDNGSTYNSTDQQNQGNKEPTEIQSHPSLQFIIGMSVAAVFITIILIVVFVRIYTCKKQRQQFRDAQPRETYSNQNQQEQGRSSSIQSKLKTRIQAKQKDCAICLEGSCNAILPCRHYFHYRCILEWLIKKKKCPLCRQKTKVTALKSFQSDKGQVDQNVLQTLSINNYNDYNNQHLNINAAILDHSIQNSYEVNHNVLGSMDSNRAIAYPNMISYGSTDTYTQNQNITHQTTNTQPSDYLSAYSAAHSRNSELNPSMGVHGQLYVLSSSNQQGFYIANSYTSTNNNNVVI